MLTAMEDVKTARLGRILWAAAGVLLLLVWIASMPLDDDRLCSPVPVCFGLAVVLVLGGIGMVAGARPARPTLTCLLGLGAGLYFFTRCLYGDMLSEVVRELPLICSAFVFYGSGYLMAQRRGGMALSLALSLAVLLNVVCFFLLQGESIPIEATGRPSVSLAGDNRPSCTLFTYPNFSAMFLMLAGGVLVCRPLWTGWKGWWEFVAALVGMVGMACSCLCGSRSVVALFPLMLVTAWMLWVIIRLYCAKKLGYGVVISGVVLLVGILVLLGELLVGKFLWLQILSVDTDGRSDLWGLIYSMLPQVPACGNGPGATAWQLVTVYTGWRLPNYAHNDYLQAWVDYGVVGVVLVVSVVLAHLVSGFWSLAAEDVSSERRGLVASCILVVLSLACCAALDFVWHSIALVGLTAFACGVLAAPVPVRREPWFRRRRWAAGHQPPLCPVRFMGMPGAALCCVGCMSLAVVCGGFACRLFPGWRAQWEYNALCQSGAGNEERMAFLERVMPLYPDPELVDHYVTLRPPAQRGENDACKEKMLRWALQSNPHQLFTTVMLADVLSRTGRCAEAEELMRSQYTEDGMPSAFCANWPAYYGMNLLRWGKQRMEQGDHGSALSMMEYALHMWGHADAFRQRRGSRVRLRATNSYVAARRVDVDMLHAIGTEKNDAWKMPMHPGGRPALYARWENVPHNHKVSDPYARRSPLKF